MGMWHADFAISLMHMILAFNQFRVGNEKDQSLQVMHSRGSILPKQRCEMVKQALETKATHLLFIDSDHTFPRSTLHRLLAANKEVVAANCVTKTIPANPTARLAPKDGDPGYGVPTYSDEGRKLERVWRVGTGVMLVKTDVFRRTGLDIFSMYYRPEVENYQGEDWTMCEAFDRVGAEIWVDHDLSREIGHIGFFTYTHDYVGEITQEKVA